MTVAELKARLNKFDDSTPIRFTPFLVVNGNWNYPEPLETDDMTLIDIFESDGRCVIENSVPYCLDI